ncbi:uncharacterized [Tachysurus ichikawai]
MGVGNGACMAFEDGSVGGIKRNPPEAGGPWGQHYSQRIRDVQKESLGSSLLLTDSVESMQLFLHSHKGQLLTAIEFKDHDFRDQDSGQRALSGLYRVSHLGWCHPATSE